MGKIILEKMQFLAYHGHYPEEKVVGNKFEVDLKIEAPLTSAGKSDDLNDTLNYQLAYAIVKKVMDQKYNLLEKIGYEILNEIQSAFSEIGDATVYIRKINPPMGGQMDNVAVEMNLQDL